VKGIMSAEEARTAVEKGVQRIIVSGRAERPLTGLAQPIEVLPAIADAVGGKVPILVDGSFRRASDVLKGLALGAQAVLLGRPPGLPCQHSCRHSLDYWYHQLLEECRHECQHGRPEAHSTLSGIRLATCPTRREYEDRP